MDYLVIAILIFVVIVIIIIMMYLFNDPYTLQNNIQNSQSTSTIAASTLATNSGSPNFAYSIWFYINDWTYNYGKEKVLFIRPGTSTTGLTTDGSISSDKIKSANPCPAVSLDANNNQINIYLNTGTSTSDTITSAVESISISNIPIQSWVNLAISVYGTTLDVYINGKLVKTQILKNTVKINNTSDIIITPLGGFSGFNAKFQYYPTAINPQQAWNNYTAGYSSWLASLNTYQVQLSLIENGTTQNSITI